MKKMIIMRTVAAVMAAVMVLALATGCKRDKGDSFEPPEFVFTSEFVSFPEDIIGVRNLVYAGDKIYFSAELVLDAEAYTYITKIFSMDLDGSNLNELTNYVAATLAEGAEGYVSIGMMLIDTAGDLWVSESGYMYRYNVPEDFEGEEEEKYQFYEDLGAINNVRKLDSTGAELFSVDIGALSGGNREDYMYISALNIDDSGNIYLGVVIGDSPSIFVLSNDGSLQFKLDTSNWINQLIRMPDGSIAISGYTDNGMALTKIDYTQRAWGNSVDLPSFLYMIYPGGDQYDLVYTNNSSLYGFNLETGESEKLLSWIDSDIISDNLDNITILPDGRVLCTNQSWDKVTGVSSSDLIILTRTPYADLPEKTVLSFATFWLDWNLRHAIVEFNRTNPSYRIQVFEYSEFSTDEDWQAGLTRLSAEIISGKVPDLLDVSRLPFKQYVARNVLEDLYPYIDSDPELNRSDFVESAFRAVEMDGGLYQLFTTFWINSLIGHPSIVGENMGWNMSEFKAVLDANPKADLPLGMWLTKEIFLQQSIMLSMDEYVDWAAGKVNFNNENFIQLLEFANTFPAEYDFDPDVYIDEFQLVSEGRQIMVSTSIANFDSVQMYRGLFGGDIVFKGFPSENRNGNSLSIDSGIAITTKCTDKEGAWEFIRTFLDKDWQLTNTWGFPTNKAAFNEKLKEAMTEDEDASYSMGWGNDMMFEIGAVTQEEADQIIALIDSVSGASGWDEALSNIILEDAKDFFNGISTAQDAARVIQSRASIYISEQS